MRLQNTVCQALSLSLLSLRVSLSLSYRLQPISPGLHFLCIPPNSGICHSDSFVYPPPFPTQTYTVITPTSKIVLLENYQLAFEIELLNCFVCPSSNSQWIHFHISSSVEASVMDGRPSGRVYIFTSSHNAKGFFLLFLLRKMMSGSHKATLNCRIRANPNFKNVQTSLVI